ncbi:MAG: CoA-binding protein [Desulfobacterales bacterium]|nr:CoA-binding protein [Desulfobacterales bacterium]MCP4159701.1 CoA-binding protein [Deltaproteobacteria bacterium]
MAKIVTEDRDIKKILEETKSIAIIGLSPKPERDSNKVGKFLKDNDFKIIPIRPAQKEILGEKAYKNLDDVENPVDMVNVFRSSDQIMPHAEEAIRNGAKVFWMQLGIENNEAAKLLTDAGINVIMNRCTKIEYDKFFKKKILV